MATERKGQKKKRAEILGLIEMYLKITVISMFKKIGITM